MTIYYHSTTDLISCEASVTETFDDKNLFLTKNELFVTKNFKDRKVIFH